LWQVVVYPKAKKKEWHVKKCMFSQCNQCGVKNLAFYLVECNGDGPKMVEWCRFVMETMMSRVGKPLKKLFLVYKQTTSNELMEYMKLKL
jgi:hypothetical protein